MRGRVKKVEKARGVFGNAMEYARFGSGSRTVLAVPGGPGNTLPAGLMERMIARMFRPFLDDDYTVWIVTRRRGMPHGHTIEAMADDFAELIGEEFGGLIDVYVGISLGGAVGRAMIEAGEFIIKAFIHDGEREVDIGGTRYPADVSLWPMYYPKMERIKA